MDCFMQVGKDFAPSNPFAASSPPSMQTLQDWYKKKMKAYLPCMCNTNFLTSYDSFLRTCSPKTQFDPAILTKAYHDACNGNLDSLFPLSNSGNSGSAAGSSTGSNPFAMLTQMNSFSGANSQSGGAFQNNNGPATAATKNSNVPTSGGSLNGGKTGSASTNNVAIAGGLSNGGKTGSASNNNAAIPGGLSNGANNNNNASTSGGLSNDIANNNNITTPGVGLPTNNGSVPTSNGSVQANNGNGTSSSLRNVNPDTASFQNGLGATKSSSSPSSNKTKTFVVSMLATFFLVLFS
jgi:hypothetical protein